MRDYLHLATFSNPFQYAVLKSILEREEIRFFFQNETVLGIMPFHSSPNGGIHLKIHPEDFQEAKLLLEEFNYTSHLKII
ncbi:MULTISPECIES: putative signal transducing protein [Mesonia]|uniref:Uncharacterized protein n=1 Tax=Mesonia oceanica TaxID=2687242 RepID=A0AC61Y618_9FLAO|nr:MULTISPECIES: DUF2007 domain-containing protein [Mesonia]MAN28564.1 hypothetical protein [Mesonia sp.]MAQ41245.1 hypothetical protein [Mesonia sp.]MBJ97344.1 hypothetical protein [Flavobacteriaceae bacterium]VVU98819.1 hypothetical protein FVB9532_00066 [Mesonia oceanica]|tara:strand:- start:167 stop:406 length:240 start_codon:yes stop_codon:yes gene_type:complete